MVIGKFKYMIGPVSGMISHPLGSSRFIFVRTYGCRVVGLCSRGGFRIHRLERKGKSSVSGSEVNLYACGLGSPGQVEIRFRIVRSHGMRLLNVFGHTELQVEQMLIILLYD